MFVGKLFFGQVCLWENFLWVEFRLKHIWQVCIVEPLYYLAVLSPPCPRPLSCFLISFKTKNYNPFSHLILTERYMIILTNMPRSLFYPISSVSQMFAIFVQSRLVIASIHYVTVFCVTVTCATTVLNKKITRKNFSFLSISLKNHT